jgi:hypothetical protein
MKRPFSVQRYSFQPSGNRANALGPELALKRTCLRRYVSEENYILRKEWPHESSRQQLEGRDLYS